MCRLVLWGVGTGLGCYNYIASIACPKPLGGKYCQSVSVEKVPLCSQVLLLLLGAPPMPPVIPVTVKS